MLCPNENILKGCFRGKSCTEIFNCVPLGSVVPGCCGKCNKAGLTSLWARSLSPWGRVVSYLVLVVASQGSVECETAPGCGTPGCCSPFPKANSAMQPLQGCCVGWQCVLPNSMAP